LTPTAGERQVPLRYGPATGPAASKNPAQRLSDILNNIDAIESFTAEISFEAFCLDRKTLYAVVRALEIISKASRRIPDELIHRHAAIDWQAIAAAGNIYRHEYDAVDEALLWAYDQT
jgi:uncharacterized protein with HEPN domain